MDKDHKEQQCEEIPSNEEALIDRRGFLLGLKKWSKIVIGSALLGSVVLNSDAETEAAAWANRGGGGAAWANRGGGGGAWANHGGGGGAWANRGAGWVNRGAAWVNRY